MTTVVGRLVQLGVSGEVDRAFDVADKELTIGRQVGCDVHLKYAAISRRHATLAVQSGGSVRAPVPTTHPSPTKKTSPSLDRPHDSPASTPSDNTSRNNPVYREFITCKGDLAYPGCARSSVNIRRHMCGHC